MTRGRTIPALALAFSLALHAAAFAALLADWRSAIVEQPALSVELVVVLAPVEAQSIESSPTAPQEAAAPATDSTPTPPVENAPAQAAPTPKPAPEPPKPVKKADAPKPAVANPAPPRFEAPINLNPGSLTSEETRQAKAPSGREGPPAFAVLYGPTPPYPPQARERGLEGRVALEVTMGLDGVPTRVVVARSSGASLLDDAAMATVKTWRFRNDSGQPLTLTVPIVFELRASARR